METVIVAAAPPNWQSTGTVSLLNEEIGSQCQDDEICYITGCCKIEYVYEIVFLRFTYTR